MLNISARNQFHGTVKSIEEGAVNDIVVIETKKGKQFTADITKASVERLGLAVGKPAIAVFKATSVMVAEGEPQISARNQFAGTVKSVEEGAVNGIVEIKLDCDCVVTADITMGSIKRMGLEAGKPATAVVKATEVMVATEE
jgi:molybdate transport system regulatory protein